MEEPLSVPAYAKLQDFESDTSREKDRRNGTDAAGTSSSIVTLFTGLAIISAPYAFASAGWALGTLLIAGFAVSTMLSLHFLSQALLEIDVFPASYSVACRRELPAWSLAVDICFLIITGGYCISYLIYIGALMPEVLASAGVENSFLLRRQLWITVTAVFVGPLAFRERLYALRRSTTLALLVIVAVIGSMVAYGFNNAAYAPCLVSQIKGKDCKDAEMSMWGSSDGGLKALSVLAVCFNFHTKHPAVTSDLRRPKRLRLTRVTNATVLLAVVLYLSVSWAAYTAFGPEVSADVLSDYPDSALFGLVKVSVCVVAAACYPLQAHPGRESLMSLLLAGSAAGKAVRRAARRFGEKFDIVGGGDGGSRDRGGSAGGDGSGAGGERSRNGSMGGSGLSLKTLLISPSPRKGSTEGREDHGHTSGSGGRRSMAAVAPRLEEGGGSGGKASDTGSTSSGSVARAPFAGNFELYRVPQESSHGPDGGGCCGSARRGRDTTGSKAEKATPEPLPGPESPVYVLATSLFLLGTWGVSMLVSDVGVVIELIGATGSTAVSVVLPPCIFLATQRRRRRQGAAAANAGASAVTVRAVGGVDSGSGDGGEGGGSGCCGGGGGADCGDNGASIGSCGGSGGGSVDCSGRGDNGGAKECFWTTLAVAQGALGILAIPFCILGVLSDR